MVPKEDEELPEADWGDAAEDLEGLGADAVFDAEGLEIVLLSHVAEVVLMGAGSSLDTAGGGAVPAPGGAGSEQPSFRSVNGDFVGSAGICSFQSFLGGWSQFQFDQCQKCIRSAGQGITGFEEG